MKKILLAALLSGCATFQNPPHCVDRGDGICWWVNPVQIPVTSVRWEVDTSANASHRCGYGFHFEHASCVMGRLRETGECWVVSALTENQAMRTPTGARNMWMAGAKSIWEHEVIDHCGLGGGVQWLHSDRAITPAGWRR